MVEKEKTIVRFHQIDGLRAVAVLLVVVHHSFTAMISSVLRKNGFIFVSKYFGYLTASGVDLFFVISGVVLLRPYLRHQRVFNSARYFKRRIERLWPPFLVVWLITCLVIFIISFTPTWYSENHIAKFTFIQCISQMFIIQIGNSPLINAAWWSLSVEVFFYLLIPFLLIIFLSIKNRYMYCYFLLAFLIAEILFYYRDSGKELLSLFPTLPLFFIYGSCFLAGIIMAAKDFEMYVGILLLMAGIIYTIFATVYGFNHHNGFALLYSGIVIISFYPNNILNKLLQKYLMVWTGERSYSIFLIHITVFMLINYIFSLIVFKRYLYYYLLIKFFGFWGTLLASMTLFYFVERRFARGLVTGNQFWFKNKRNA